MAGTHFKGPLTVAGVEVISEDGAITGDIQATAGSIGTAELADLGVTLGKLAAAITPSHIVVGAGEFTTAGGDTDETITVAGALATDLCHVTIHTVGSSPVTILDAACGAGDIDVDMSADPSTDHVLTYSVLRAAA